jgi:hypothetical protein
MCSGRVTYESTTDDSEGLGLSDHAGSSRHPITAARTWHDETAHDGHGLELFGMAQQKVFTQTIETRRDVQTIICTDTGERGGTAEGSSGIYYY